VAVALLDHRGVGLIHDLNSCSLDLVIDYYIKRLLSTPSPTQT